MKEIGIKVTHYPIRLGQFLKLADLAADGMEAKLLISGRQVFLNDRIETQRGKQLVLGDKVRVKTKTYRCS